MSIIDKVQDEIVAGELSLRQIAEKFNLPFEDVDTIFLDYMDRMADYYDDSMDGDFDSGMASAGFGTDEDYGYGGYDGE